MAFGQANDLAEELLVDLAEDFGGQNGEFVGAVGIIKTRMIFLRTSSSIVKLGRELVGRLDAVFFFLKMEQAGVVTLVGFAKELTQPAVSVLAVEQRLESAVILDARGPRRCAGR